MAATLYLPLKALHSTNGMTPQILFAFRYPICWPKRYARWTDLPQENNWAAVPRGFLKTYDPRHPACRHHSVLFRSSKTTLPNAGKICFNAYVGGRNPIRGPIDLIGLIAFIFIKCTYGVIPEMR